MARRNDLQVPARRALRTVLAVAATLTALAGAMPPTRAHAATFELLPYAGVIVFDDELALKDRVHFGGRLGLYPIRYLGIEGNFGYSKTELDAPMTTDVEVMNFGGDLVVRLAPDLAVVPFVLGGVGAVRLEPSDPSLLGLFGGADTTVVSFDVGGGLLFRLSHAIGIRVEARDVIHKLETANDDLRHNVVATGGINLAFGGALPDTDLDGVPDKRDRCPDTPLGALVDKDGCPIDSDGDGVADGIDRCPDTPRGATVDAEGCPADSDGDGVFDGIDGCPDTPSGARVDATGCPLDADGDGVADGIDQCPNTPAGATVDAQGCPLDSDGDGVFDGLDLCPNTPAGAKVDKDGCPIEISERETQFLDTGLIRLADVNFETAKAEILPSSLPLLDEVGQILVQWPQLRIEIGGHTDSRGSDAYNQALSERRAQAVLDYLVAKFPGIDPNQYTVKGYGEAEPILPNTSATNMAKNRRVEFKVLNTDVLKKEVERRRLMQQGE